MPRLWNVSTVENNLSKFAVANESAFSNQDLAPPSKSHVKDDKLEFSALHKIGLSPPKDMHVNGHF